MRKEEKQIIEKVVSGDRNAFAFLVDAYKDKVFSLIYGILKDYELSSEVSQDVFIKAYTSLANFRREASFSTWIYRIAYNSAISETRKASFKRKKDIDISNLQNDFSEDENYGDFIEERKRQLKLAIDSLNETDKFLLNLYYSEEKSIEEISHICSLSKSNVKVKLHRIREKLKLMVETV